MKVYIFIILSFTLSSILISESYECVYIEGYADIVEENNSIPIDFGSMISNQDTILLDKESIVQLDSGKNTLFFTKAGRYSLSDFSNASTEVQNQLNRISGKIATIVTEQDFRTQSTVMGIRGSEADIHDDLGFETTSNQEIEEIWNKINNGKFAEAEEDLEFLYSMSADPFSEGKLLYSLAYVEDRQGKIGEAWSHLGDIIMPERGDYYASYLLLSGKLEIKSRNYAEAKATLETFLIEFPRHAAVDEAKSLLELCE